MITAPEPNEYPAYFEGYINLAKQQGDILETLSALKSSTNTFLKALPAQKYDYTYASGKWTVKQMLGHMIDAEQVFAFRILCFSRKDASPLPGFNEDDYVNNAAWENHSFDELVQYFQALRQANLFLYRSITGQQSLLLGSANGKPVSVRALLYIAAGHELHHLNILRERYL